MVAVLAFINAFLATCLKPAVEALIKCRLLQGVILGAVLMQLGPVNITVGILVIWFVYVCIADRDLLTRFREKYDEYRRDE